MALLPEYHLRLQRLGHFPISLTDEIININELRITFNEAPNKRKLEL